MSPWLTVPLNWGLFYGLYVGLLMGGTACIVHISLRVVFYFYQFMPWNYVRFLDYAVDRIFLQKVGGGYIFIHRLLMEHFAAMPVEKRAVKSEYHHWVLLTCSKLDIATPHLWEPL